MPRVDAANGVEMTAGDSEFESWWNQLEPEQRIQVFRLVPLRRPEQIAVFSRRSWHELNGWMRTDLRKLYGTPGILDEFGPLIFFRCQARLGRGESVNGVTYFVISHVDRVSLPELADFYAIALEELTRANGKGQFWLIASEAAYDEEVLLALSSVRLTTGDKALLQ